METVDDYWQTVLSIDEDPCQSSRCYGIPNSLYQGHESMT